MSYTIGQVIDRLGEFEQQRGRMFAAVSTLRGALASMRAARFENATDDTLIKLYLDNRDNELAAIKKETEALEKIVKDEQAAVEQELARRLRERGARNTKTDNGVAFFQETTSVRTENKDEFTRWVIGGERWDMVDWRPAKAAIEDMMATQESAQLAPEPPPGVKIESIVKVHVRKS